MINLINKDTWIISDHHLNHKNICSFEPCRLVYKELGFVTIEDMLIHNHNKVVKKDDLVVFLGDFSFNSPEKWIKKFNGRKILILGNHDRKSTQAYKDFDYVVRGIEIDYNDQLLTHKTDDELLSAAIINVDNYAVGLCHYPIGYNDIYDKNRDKIQSRLKTIEPLFDSFSLDIIIHGHLHSNKYTNPPQFPKLINVSCEKLNFTPVKLGDLLDL